MRRATWTAVELSGFSIPEMDRLRWRHAEEYQHLDEMVTAFLLFDVLQPPFDDPRVRRAFAHTVDIEILANEVLHGYEPPATGGLIPPGLAGHSPEIALPYDPTQARKLLAEAGYSAGRGFPRGRVARSRSRGNAGYNPSLWFQPGHRRLPGQPVASGAESRNRHPVGVFRHVSRASAHLTSTDQPVALGG